MFIVMDYITLIEYHLRGYQFIFHTPQKSMENKSGREINSEI